MTDRTDPTPAVEALRDALAYAIARVPPPPAARSVREYAADLAPYLIESGYLTPAQPVTETTDLPCGYCSRDYPHSHTKAILIGPDEPAQPVTETTDLRAVADLRAALDMARSFEDATHADMDCPGWTAFTILAEAVVTVLDAATPDGSGS